MILGRLASLARDAWLGRNGGAEVPSPSTIGETLDAAARTAQHLSGRTRTTVSSAARSLTGLTSNATRRLGYGHQSTRRISQTLNVRLKDGI